MKLFKKRAKYYDASECEHLRTEGKPCRECEAEENRREGAKSVLAMLVLQIGVALVVAIVVFWFKE